MNKLLFIVFAAFSAACSDTTPLPADPQATPETQALYRNLFRIADEGVMFGHQDDALYGHDWKYEEGRSDVRECCGDYPAVFGWELGGLETGADRSIDDVPFAEITRLLCAAYGRGAVNTVSWHPQNPESGASAWDGKTSTAVSSILPGGANHAQFRLWLDRLATERVFRCCSVRSTSTPAADSGGAKRSVPPTNTRLYGASRWNICAM